MKKLIMFILTGALLFFGGCSNSTAGSGKKVEKTPLTISAAASLTEALEEIKDLYEADHPVDITFNFGGSGTLAQQIQQGAPADIFISANQDWMNMLEKENAIISDTKVSITGNTIVLVAGPDTSLTYESVGQIDPRDISQIAIGNPDSVPAGQYTKQVLQYVNKWDELEDQDDKFVRAKDVRQVLTYVETGNAELGFVYKSDAMTSDSIRILTEADRSFHDPIIYPGAVTSGTKHEEEAQEFLQFLNSKEAQDIFEKYGFKK
ncbi:molybdate ABC transporter substrate-binding protein [Siminovitchia sediminis]|uniref:Molybdate ABC transporter substrate-binding protein n=1 Tax=Siminovitchia sediminis TaxID=1274353 RepID=A0ABW4KB12_9BACI